MARYRRSRRQGVIYGPPGRAGAPDGSGIVGRVLGPVIIVGALGLLAAGAWAWAGTADAPPAVTPTRGAIASPSPTASPTLAATPTALASPTTRATIAPSPSPTLAIEVREGPGAITFGTQYDEGTLRVTDARTTFPARGRFVWSAQLTEPAGAPALLVVISDYDPSTAAETVISEETTEVQNEQASIFLRRLPMQRIVDGPGIYVVRYYRGEILLAEGFFRVE